MIKIGFDSESIDCAEGPCGSNVSSSASEEHPVKNKKSAEKEKYDLKDWIRFNEEVVSCVFQKSRWQLKTASGVQDIADVVILTVGAIPEDPESIQSTMW